MEIYLQDHTGVLTSEYEHLIMDLLEYAGKELSLAPDTEMSVTIVDNQEIQEINREYRHKDQPTDVISFAIEDNPEDIFLPEEFAMEIPRDLGDIFVSIDRAKEQAEEYGHSLKRELGFLVVHGFLHLNGYDHMEPEEEKEMFALQNQILEHYGLQR